MFFPDSCSKEEVITAISENDPNHYNLAAYVIVQHENSKSFEEQLQFLNVLAKYNSKTVFDSLAEKFITTHSKELIENFEIIVKDQTLMFSKIRDDLPPYLCGKIIEMHPHFDYLSTKIRRQNR